MASENSLHRLFAGYQHKCSGRGFGERSQGSVRANEVRLILKSADREVQNACAEYICETPVSNPAPGTYTTTQTLKLEGNCQKIYYTLDGNSIFLE